MNEHVDPIFQKILSDIAGECEHDSVLYSEEGMYCTNCGEYLTDDGEYIPNHYNYEEWEEEKADMDAKAYLRGEE